jgi:ribosomal protein S18 acetylase RimI-like enzyme
VDHSAEVPESITVRAAVAADIEQIRALAIGNGMFAPEDMGGFDDGLNGYLSGELEGHRWLVATGPGGRVEGAAYVAPEPFGDRVWNLYFLAADPSRHRRGAGSSLVRNVEQTLRAEGDETARVLIVETLSSAAYEGARRFYASRGFDREALIREFYGPGEDKIVFWKSLV